MPSTLTGLCEYREEIRKSRFITFAAPITSAQQALEFIEQHSDLNASHNCWAWKLGGQYRSSDDGEPGGTAGRPILSAIEAQDCDQVAVLVIRWYGGIQLGTGGLAWLCPSCKATCMAGKVCAGSSPKPRTTHTADTPQAAVWRMCSANKMPPIATTG